MNPALKRLADVHGVATEYEDQQERTVLVDDDVVRAVLEALGVDTDEPASDEPDGAPAGPPPVVVVRTDETRQVNGVEAPAALITDDGDQIALGETSVVLPAGLPLGWHELCGADGTSVPVCVAPSALPRRDRGWGFQVQLYQLRSAGSWGIGDLRDLETLVTWTAEHGGDLVLVNPLHASLPGLPVEPSPYSPSSRRWASPLYLRVEDTDAYAVADGRVRAVVNAMQRGLDNRSERIDRDAAWTAKLQALELLWEQVCADESALSAVSEMLRDLELLQFATYEALAERHGRDWRKWPSERLKDPVAAVMSNLVLDDEALFDRVMFHAWLQHLCLAQLERVQRTAQDAGMDVGVVHDLAVGVVPGGADGWTLQDDLAHGLRIGAPPDGFNQKGQDWGMPPWHPERLRESAYQPVRSMVRSLLRYAGGLRLDHVLGLFRLWCIPEGSSAREGTFVSYDADELLGVIMLEAEQAGAILIGEDLGTVPAEVEATMAARDLLGTTVLWFERDGVDGPLRAPGEWREAAVGSVTTHDLPTAVGWLRGEHVRVRAELGLLDDPDKEWAAWLAERQEFLDWLVEHELLDPADTEDETQVVRALHRAVAATPSRYVLASLVDALGEVSQPNLPGTVDEYPNWRLPLADSSGQVLLLEEALADARVDALAGDLDAGVQARVR